MRWRLLPVLEWLPNHNIKRFTGSRGGFTKTPLAAGGTIKAMKKITLIMGGIRSGKSYFAEQRAEYCAENPVYLATALSVANDPEMAQRIRAHRERRGQRYETIEAPYDITGPLARLKKRTVIVDCLTLNLSNRLLSSVEFLSLEQIIETDEEYLEEIRQIIYANDLRVIFVANEVGWAPVEMNKLGRFFQDLQGRWNRIVAEYADEVYWVRAGIPELIKKESCAPFRVGAPSYVLPTGYLENVTYLMEQVQDIQLLVFDNKADDPLFQENTLTTLSYLARESDLHYSVHMPVKPLIFENAEQRFHDAVFIIEKMQTLPISAFTFHYDLPAGKEWRGLSKQEIQGINRIYSHFFKLLRERFPLLPLTLENTATPLSALDKVVKGCGLSYCIDIGHLWVQGWDLQEIEKRLVHSPVVHFHGWEEREGRKVDHRAVEFQREIFSMLESFTGVVTIENYHPVLLQRSLQVLRDYF